MHSVNAALVALSFICSTDGPTTTERTAAWLITEAKKSHYNAARRFETQYPVDMVRRYLARFLFSFMYSPLSVHSSLCWRA